MCERAVRLRERPFHRKALLLVAEDHEPTFELIRLLCEMEGIGVLRAMTTRAALALARVGQPDLILMNTCLADGAATRAVRAIRRDASTRNIPIVAMPSPGVEARPGRYDGVLPQPVNPARFLGMIRRRFSGTSRPPGRHGPACTRPRAR